MNGYDISVLLVGLDMDWLQDPERQDEPARSLADARRLLAHHLGASHDPCQDRWPCDVARALLTESEIQAEAEKIRQRLIKAGNTRGAAEIREAFGLEGSDAP